MNNVPRGKLCLTAYFFLFAKLHGLESSLLGEVETDIVEEEELGA